VATQTNKLQEKFTMHANVTKNWDLTMGMQPAGLSERFPTLGRAIQTPSAGWTADKGEPTAEQKVQVRTSRNWRVLFLRALAAQAA
jgi:hypothetical protein